MSSGAVKLPFCALWDFLSPRGENVMQRWAKKEKLSSKDRAVLDQRLDRLVQVKFEDAIDIKLLNGPIRKEIYKLKAYGQVMMRPLLCRGPFDKLTEYTLLIGAIERDWELDPPTCKTDAQNNRNTLLENKNRRTKHVGY
jgi:hypothetical protein